MGPTYVFDTAAEEMEGRQSTVGNKSPAMRLEGTKTIPTQDMFEEKFPFLGWIC